MQLRAIYQSKLRKILEGEKVAREKKKTEREKELKRERKNFGEIYFILYK